MKTGDVYMKCRPGYHYVKSHRSTTSNWGKAGEDYARKVFDLYEKSKK